MGQELVLVFSARGFANELTAINCESHAQFEEFSSAINNNVNAWVASAEQKQLYLSGFYGDYSSFGDSLPAIIAVPD